MIPRQSRSRPTDFEDRVDRLEERLARLERTVAAIAGEAMNATVAGPCPGCRRSLLLLRAGMLECPCCEYRRSL